MGKKTELGTDHSKGMQLGTQRTSHLTKNNAAQRNAKFLVAGTELLVLCSDSDTSRTIAASGLDSICAPSGRIRNCTEKL